MGDETDDRTAIRLQPLIHRRERLSGVESFPGGSDQIGQHQEARPGVTLWASIQRSMSVGS